MDQNRGSLRVAQSSWNIFKGGQMLQNPYDISFMICDISYVTYGTFLHWKNPKKS